jgi:hypothetical protein
MLSATGVGEPWASLGWVGVRFAAGLGARSGPPPGGISRCFTHLGATALRLSNGTTTVAGRGSLAREGDRTVSVKSGSSTETSQGKNQGGRQISFRGVSVEGKAHEASLDQAEKKTYGAARLRARVT